MNPATAGYMAENEAEIGQQMERSDRILIQYATEALEHAVKWNGIAHLGAEKAKALLDELERLRKELDGYPIIVMGIEQGRREERERLVEVVKGLQKRYSNTACAEVWEVGVQDGLSYVLAALEEPKS